VSASLTLAYHIKTLAEKYADRPAIAVKSAFRTFSFSYREMYRRSLALANYLAHKGIHKGDRILVWSYNGEQYASILLGCALSGVVIVPIDFGSKADFVRLIAEEVGARCLFHSKRRPFPHAGLSHFYVEDLDRELAEVPIDKTDFGVREEDIYEIVYTSGTTSEPKGVILTNKNIVSNIMHIAEVMPIRSDNICLSILPLSHMLEQVPGFFYPLSCGCTITYLHSRKSTALVGALQGHRITAMVVVPVFLSILRENILREVQARGRERLFSRMLSLAGRLPTPARRLLFRGIHKKLGGRLRMFVSSGSALEPELEQFWTALGCEVFQGYGLTETTTAVTANTRTHHRAGSVGRCVPHQEVKLGPDNEIWTRGDNVTPGYWENPEENAARFEDGWFKTGDIGEFDNDGYLFFRGRLKNMIKSASGLNVYPEDIEAVLGKMPGVKDCCIIGLEEGGDVRVHAVILMEKDAAWDNNSVRSMIAVANQVLQPHQQIQGFTVWPHDDFPRTNTLKIKRGPVWEEIQRGKPAAGPAPRTSGDRILDILASLAKVDVQTITPEWNLVSDLGLDSVARVELTTMLEEEFNVEIDEGALGAGTTVADVKAIVASRQSETLHYRFPRWSRAWPARALRWLLQLGVFRFPSLFSRTTVLGRENLRGLKTPAIFIANHTSQYDILYIIRALPWRLRKIALGAAADLAFEFKPGDSWRKWLYVHVSGFLATLLMNLFPFSRGGHVKKSFEYLGELLDDGWNILLFPEGQITTTGEMDRFKGGIGLLAQAMQAPVVPVRIDGVWAIVPMPDRERLRWIPKRFGRVSVTFGQPIPIDPNAHPDQVARTCEEAIRSLSPNQSSRSAR
jgi:long-chain acyl-CoA synthetase